VYAQQFKAIVLKETNATADGDILLLNHLLKELIIDVGYARYHPLFTLAWA
jgi:hypothetical protein